MSFTSLDELMEPKSESKVKRALSDDGCFKLVLGDEKDREPLIHLVNATLREANLPTIASLTLNNPVVLRRKRILKELVFDISAVDENGALYDIEMQRVYDKSFIARLLCYSGATFYARLDRGENFDKLRRVLTIAFVEFSLPGNKELWFDSWSMHSDVNGKKISDLMGTLLIRIPKTDEEQERALSYLRDDDLKTWIGIWGFPSLTDGSEIKEIANNNKNIVGGLNRMIGFFETIRRRGIERRRTIEYKKARHARVQAILERTREEGIAEGRAEGVAKLRARIIRVCEKRFPEEMREWNALLETKLQGKDFDEVADLTSQVAVFDSLDAFIKTL